MGYHRAGFDVVGVDIAPQHSYPFWDIEQGDAMVYLADHDYLREFDVVHASPPCQAYSAAMAHLAHPQPKLIAEVRHQLVVSGVSYVIENVPGAPMRDPAIVCGTGLGMRIYRHRLFESNLPLQGTTCDHSQPALNPHWSISRQAIRDEFGDDDPEAPWRREMGVEWMDRQEAREAVPPAYTEHIGRQLIKAMSPNDLAAAK